MHEIKTWKPYFQRQDHYLSANKITHQGWNKEAISSDLSSKVCFLSGESLLAASILQIYFKREFEGKKKKVTC